MAHDAKPGERGLPEPEKDLTEEEAVVTVPDDDLDGPSDLNLDGELYTEPLIENVDDDVVAEGNDEEQT